MHLCVNQNGQEYLFKPAVRKGTVEEELFRAEVQVLASKLQEIISPDTAVECKLIEIDGKIGTIQPKIKVDSQKTKKIEGYYWNKNVLDESIARQFMREYIVDYCLCNYDSHYRNFIVDENGNLRGIDKEQSLRYIKDSETDGDLKFDGYHPNAIYGEQPPIYGKIFRDIEDGKISSDVLCEVTKGIERVRKTPKEDFLNMFKPYIRALTNDEEMQNLLYGNISRRIDSLSDVQRMVEKYQKKESLTELSTKFKFLKGKLDALINMKSKDNNKEHDDERRNTKA